MLGTKTVCLFLDFITFLRAVFSFSVQNLTQLFTLNLFSAKHSSRAPPRKMTSVNIIKRKCISKSPKYLQSSRKMTFLSNEHVFLRLKLFFIHPNEKKIYVVSPAFQNLTLFVVNSVCYKFLAGVSLHNYFVERDKMQANIQGVEHDLRRIEQIDSGLCNNKDTQRVIQELGSTQTNNNNFANFVS